MSWARRLKRVFGVEIESCTRCGGELKIIASIEEPQLIAKREYQKNFARGRTAILIAYLRSVARTKGWGKRNPIRDAALYEALLRAGIFEDALHGLLTVSSDVLDKHALASSKTMWKFLTADCG